MNAIQIQKNRVPSGECFCTGFIKTDAILPKGHNYEKNGCTNETTTTPRFDCRSSLALVPIVVLVVD
jgi:hypothetical protein